MLSAFQTFGKLGALASSVARAWSPLALWPDGAASPGMWIDPSLLTASFNDSTGTTPVAMPGSVADSANPVGLALDIRAGATSVTDPGNHMLQASTTARPLESALVNLVLAKATDPFNSSTDMTGASTSSVSVSFSGGVNTLTRQAGTDSFVYWDKSGLNTFGGLDPTTPVTFTYSVRGVGSAIGRSFALKIVRTAVTTSYVTLTGDWVTVSVAVSPSGNPTVYTYFLLFGESSTANMEVGESVEVKDLQVNYGGPLTYQPVNSTTTYDAAAITPWQLYDGTDDSQATATFAAGTLIDGMDCMIPVRRDSSMGSLAQVVGLYTVDNAKLFGAVQGGGTDPVNYSAGDPDIYVDGYIVYPCTRDTLNTALTVGAWHILEFRNLSLSTWDSLGFGGFIYGRFPGARGDIMLFESTASTADKDAARQYLADKYGVTLA